MTCVCLVFFFFQAEDGIRDLVRSRGLGDVYKRQGWYDDAGHMGIMAPNGKVVSVEREAGGLLVADRDYVGEWEYFELVDQGQGLFALKNSNGKFVCPHYDLPGASTNRLLADRDEANEWERSTIVQDPAIVQ